MKNCKVSEEAESIAEGSNQKSPPPFFFKYIEVIYSPLSFLTFSLLKLVWTFWPLLRILATPPAHLGNH